MKRALVKRWNALGDVLLTTPIVRRLHEEGYEVDVNTLMTDVFSHSPHARAFSGLRQGHSYYHKVVELNHAYEKTPKMHIIDAYSLAAFGDTKTEHKCELFFNGELRPQILSMLPNEDFVVVHMGIGWENRTFSWQFWSGIVDTLAAITKLHVIAVGNRHEHHDIRVDVRFKGRFIDLTEKLSIHELAQVISKAKLFIGPDSGPLHIAQTTNTPCIGLYTCAKAEYRIHGNVYSIIPDIDCYGCLHDEPPPVYYCGCRRKDLKCLELITPEMVLKKVEEVLR